MTSAHGHQGLDAHGIAMSADPETVRRYDHAIDCLVRFRPEVVDVAAELVAGEAKSPMAAVLMSYLHLMSTDAADLSTARSLAAELSTCTCNDRERLHALAIAAWLDGDWHGAAAILDALLVRWPTDVLALMLGHQLDFFVGDALNLRDRPLRSLREFDPDHPHASFVRGMAAFGLEECGQYGKARDLGLAAVASNPDDVWAIHAVTHTFEMQGLVDEGIRFLRSDATTWETGNLFTVHNWWHLALFELETGRTEQALAIYDHEIHHQQSAGVPIEMLDASALLWRLYLDGVDTGARFDELARSWTAILAAEPWYAFNDLHAAIAFAGAGQLGAVRDLVTRLESWGTENQARSNGMMTCRVGLPATRAVLAFAEGRYDEVVSALTPIRRTLHAFGGSHAQRDLLQRTLLEAALRGGEFELARALTAERLGLRDSSVYGWTQRARALRGLHAEGADEADRRAADHRARFLANAG